MLTLVRLGVFALWIVKLLLDPISRLSEMPRQMFQPVGVLNLLSPAAQGNFLEASTLSAFWWTTQAILVCCLFLRRPKGFALLSTVAAIFLTFYSSLIRSFGPAVHTDITLLLATYALAGYAWADLFAPKNPARASYPLVTIVAMLCLSYCIVGLNRMVVGGIDVFNSDTMETWAIDAGLRGYYFNTNIGWHIPEWPWAVFFLRSGLPVVTLFEILAPLCLAWPHFRWIFIPVMLSFHALSLVFMNIFFFDDMLLYLLLVDWSRRFPAMARP